MTLMQYNANISYKYLQFLTLYSNVAERYDCGFGIDAADEIDGYFDRWFACTSPQAQRSPAVGQKTKYKFFMRKADDFRCISELIYSYSTTTVHFSIIRKFQVTHRSGHIGSLCNHSWLCVMAEFIKR